MLRIPFRDHKLTKRNRSAGSPARGSLCSLNLPQPHVEVGLLLQSLVSSLGVLLSVYI